MPIGGMMTLADVVDAGARGREQSFERDQMERVQKQRGVYDAAGKRAQSAMQTELAAGGDQRIAMMEGATAFGTALMEGGDMDGYFKHEIKVQPLRMRMRQEALQEFWMDKDRAKLIKRVSATLPNGERIVGIDDTRGGPMPDRGTAPSPTPMAPPKNLQQGLADFETDMANPMANPVSGAGEVPIQPIQPGRPGDGRLGAPSGADRLRVRVSKNGKEEEREVDFNGFLKGVQQLAQDPAQEMEINFRQRLADIEANKQIKVGTARSVMKRGESLAQLGNNMTRDAANNAVKKEIADDRNETSRDNTQARVDGQIRASEIRRMSGSGGGSGGLSANIHSSYTNDRGERIMLMKNGKRLAVVDENGRPDKSLDYQKLLAKTANDLGKQDISPKTPEENRERAKRLLRPDSAPAAPAGTDLGKGIWK